MTLLFASLEEAYQQIPLNKTLRMVVAGHILCVVHTQDGLKAVDDACPHLGESLSKGRVNYLNELVCPWHSYRFSLKYGQEVQGKYCKDLKFYKIVFVDNQVFVEI